MKLVRALIFVTFGVGAAVAWAQGATEIYKCVDKGGRPLYTSDKRDTSGKKCQLVSREINVALIEPCIACARGHADHDDQQNVHSTYDRLDRAIRQRPGPLGARNLAVHGPCRLL